VPLFSGDLFLVAALDIVGHALRRRAGTAVIVVREVDMVFQIGQPVFAKVVI